MESLLANFIEKQEQLQESVPSHFKIQFVRPGGSASKSNLMITGGALAHRLLHGLHSVPQDFGPEQQLKTAENLQNHPHQRKICIQQVARYTFG